MIINIFVYFIAIILTFPFAITLILYWASQAVSKHKLKALHFAVNWSTILYIISDLVIIKIMFKQNVTGIVAIFLLLLLTLIIVSQWKIKTEIRFNKAFKLLWRICFILFLLLYICLFLMGIFKYLFFS